VIKVFEDFNLYTYAMYENNIPFDIQDYYKKKFSKRVFFLNI